MIITVDVDTSAYSTYELRLFLAIITDLLEGSEVNPNPPIIHPSMVESYHTMLGRVHCMLKPIKERGYHHNATFYGINPMGCDTLLLFDELY